jgi:hypothetical protein
MSTVEKDPLHIGGVLRCCIETYHEQAPPKGKAKEEDVLVCKYCSDGLIFRDGAWRWLPLKP